MRLVVLLAVVFALIVGTVGMPLGWAFFQDAWPRLPYKWVDVVTAVVTLAAVTGAWSGRRLLTAVVSLVAAGLWVYQRGCS